MTVSMCDAPDVAKFVPSDDLRAAKEASAEADAAAADALGKLYDAMAKELLTRPDVGTTDVANYLGISAGHARRLAKARGVPAKVPAEPPRRRKSTPEPDHD